ncbi:hypothetical protein H0H87_011155 [Tephrocybe sp. NHM501043]|nr:hypothetical protein H0H87_011155 [Tephrocybe sp. NHM501043]
MASATEQRDGAVEYEMSTHQRGLIDTCLEEGQFESAITLLEQLRSPSRKPTIAHIRQLIYIALQPEHPPSINDMVYTDVPASPSKATLKKRIPSGTAVLAARRLLNSFAITNTPEAISAALPFYDDLKKEESITPDDGSLESVIGPQSMCIARAKNAWSILAEGFTQRGQVLSMQAAKGKKRFHTLNEEDDPGGLENAVVGKDAWPTLSWLITLFEQDEVLTHARGSGRFSNLLLRQLPPPRNGNGPRWDTEVPLRIVFFCMEQTDVRRKALGSRLLTQLINLSATPHLDLTLFVASVYSHLTAAELEKLPALLSNLCLSSAVYKFKIVLCQRLLSGSGHGQLRNGPTRVKARALRATKPEENVVPQSTESITSAQSTKSHIPSFKEVQRSLETTTLSVGITQSILLRVKFELLTSYGILQSELASAERDSDWLNLLRAGGVNNIINSAFGSHSEDGRAYREVLQAIMLVSLITGVN